MELHYRLKQLREENNLLQREIAEKLNMPRSTYVNYENGSREPDVETIKKIANYYNCTIDYLLGMTEIRNSDEKQEFTFAMEYMKNNRITVKQLKALIHLVKTFENDK
jgi:transcriptional regulator with XRE-family HTH domain